MARFDSGIVKFDSGAVTFDNVPVADVATIKQLVYSSDGSPFAKIATASADGMVYSADGSPWWGLYESTGTTTWQTKDIKWYNGASWVIKPLKTYTGSSWVTKLVKINI